MLHVYVESCIDFCHFNYRHHVYKKNGGKEVELKEVGPRFELRCEYIPNVKYSTDPLIFSWA